MATCGSYCCDGDFNKDDVSTTRTIESCLPLPLPDEILEDIVPKAKDFAILHGAGMRYRSNYDPDSLQLAPFFLLPSAFPRREFDRVVKLQSIVNILMHRIAHDYQFLKDALEKTIKVDDFTRRLWDIYTTVREEGISQEMSLGLVRSDVMLTKCQAGCCELCQTPPFVTVHQVEVNTIASGFGHMGPISGSINRYVLGEMRKPELLGHLPENDALAGLCGGMIAAWDAYGCPKAVILFIVEDVTYNICDQRFHEYEIRRQRPDIHVIRRNLTQISQRGRLTSDKRLVIDGDEIAVVYFRAGYEPGQYHSEAEWEARLTVERSKAIKSPSIHYHLAGTKKVQQEIARPGVLNKFLSDSEAKLVSQLFTGLYTLDMSPEGDQAVQMAMDNPERFVLKPQREGGGNNVYGQEIRMVLEKIKDSQEREAYILMDRIRPPIQQNYLIRAHEPVKLVEVVSELGIFGTILGTAKDIQFSKFAGHMLRTKLSSVNEGGVAAGLGALDSVFLFD
ncbi:glutathione synthetase-like isoform X1 [Portunus trituberculatus]|nr:glutathione synthetase-like isoform X1 [Portunus trituberculatus]XP_045126153.1 glutathione synthetase-like isoform X1 [Portunus trituberculatus]XP_045126154.1 glutathione synthetase-like isoform X1 [Portunus trituberculatus]